MKKCVVLLLMIFPLLCGCESRSNGNVYELTRCAWEASLDGGGELRLTFDGDWARLELLNGNDSGVIEGRMLTNDSELIIFDSELQQNYGFTYVPRGERLDLNYKGSTVEMHKTSP